MITASVIEVLYIKFHENVSKDSKDVNLIVLK